MREARFLYRALIVIGFGFYSVGCSASVADNANAGETGDVGSEGGASSTESRTIPQGGNLTSGGASSQTPSSSSSGGAASTATTTILTNARLSETGLFETDGTTLKPGVVPYEPRFELWSDGAEKRRFLYLPEGTQIDSTDPDYWKFPVGTKVWKEFSRDGKRVETRLIEKVTPRSFRMIAFLWREDLSDADAVPEGATNARNTDHDIPSEADCSTCHQNHPDRIVGVSAVQLDHDGAGITVGRLAMEGKLSNPVPSARVLPGSSETQAALGVLHANCGICHNAQSVLPYRTLDLWLRISGLARIEDTSVYQSAVGVASGSRPDINTPLNLIVPGHPENSAVVYRMSSRAQSVAMPPLGTKDVDVTGLSSVKAFISSLK